MTKRIQITLKNDEILSFKKLLIEMEMTRTYDICEEDYEGEYKEERKQLEIIKRLLKIYEDLYKRAEPTGE